MQNRFTTGTLVRVLRRIARVWSIVIWVIALWVAIAPATMLAGPSGALPPGAELELGFYGLALVGLLVAWRREGLGGGLTLLGIIATNSSFAAFRGFWLPGLTFPALFIGIPALLFLSCWWLSRDRFEVDPQLNGHPVLK
jgi:hypothetical protein